jgi:hypothetical protein
MGGSPGAFGTFNCEAEDLSEVFLGQQFAGIQFEAGSGATPLLRSIPAEVTACFTLCQPYQIAPTKSMPRKVITPNVTNRIFNPELVLTVGGTAAYWVGSWGCAARAPHWVQNYPVNWAPQFWQNISSPRPRFWRDVSV